MIGYLCGILLEKKPEGILVLTTGGVGYEIEVPASTLCQLPDLSQETKLFILTHVREDAIRLFGFANAFDKKVFQTLINVSGVGPKAALALLGSLEGLELCEVILSGKISQLTTIPGIGLKTAERLLLELKEKIQKLLARHQENLEIQNNAHNIWSPHHLPASPPQDPSVFVDRKIKEQKIIHRQIIEDLKSALGHLGYKDRQYQEIISRVEQRLCGGEPLSLEVALKEALTKLSERILHTH